MSYRDYSRIDVCSRSTVVVKDVIVSSVGGSLR